MAGEEGETYTFYVINNGGRQSVKAMATVESTTTVIAAFKATTTSVMSPLILSDDDYYFYDTEEAAETATGLTSGGGNGSSSVSDIDVNNDKTIFVRYYYDPSTSVVDLSGSIEYNIEIGGRYLALNNRRERPETIDPLSVTEEALKSASLTTINGDGYHFIWKLYGNDPYDIALIDNYNGSTTRKLWAQWTATGTTGNHYLKPVTGTLGNDNLYGTNLASFILLKHSSGTGYTLMAATPANQPDGSGHYGYLMNSNNSNAYSNPWTRFVADDDAHTAEFIATCATPTITFDNATNEVTIESPTPGATIYYTSSNTATPPSDPTQLAHDGTGSSPLTITSVTTTTTFKAIAVRPGLDDSEVTEQTITKLDDVTYSFDEVLWELTMTSSAGATIYYTTNGDAPSTSSPAFGASPLTITNATHSMTIKAIAVKEGSISSNITTSEPIPLKTVSSPTILLEHDRYIYKGVAIEPEVTVKDGDVVIPSTEYTVSYSNNNAVGTATVHITNKEGGDYIIANGSATFEIANIIYEHAQYYILHQNGTGYLKVNSANVTLSNENTLRYTNIYNNGSSIWVLTTAGYLLNGYYYLNVVNGKTLVLSDTPSTQWLLEDMGDANGKKHIKMNDGSKDLYLCYDGGIKVVESPSKYYNACPVEITETGWSGPTTDDRTLQSPQLIKYLRPYFTQKITYSFVDDGGTTKTASNEDRYVYATYTYESGGDNKGTTWDISAEGIIYNKQASGNVSVTATFSVLPYDPIALENHPTPVTVSRKFTLQPKYFTPDAEKNYLLFYTESGDYRFPYGDGESSEGTTVKTNATKAKLTEPTNNDISWKIEVDEQGFYSFKNVTTGRYLYYDATDYGYTSDYGTVKFGATTLPSADNRYKFRLYKTTHPTYGNVAAIIPYDMQHVVYKSDGIANDIYCGFNVYTTPKVISLNKPGSSRWRIYAYEIEDRLTDNWTIAGANSTSTTGDNVFTATANYSRNIVESPENNRDLEINGTWDNKKVTYTWTLSGDAANPSYTSTTVNSAARTGKFTVTVHTMPIMNTLGEVKAVAQVPAGSYANQTKAVTASNTTIFNIYPLSTEPATFTEIATLSEITSENGNYRLTADIEAGDRPSVTNFSGCLDGNWKTIDGATEPLFGTVTGAGIVRNITFTNAAISTSGNVGAVAATADDGAKIYNIGVLSGSIGSTDGYCGSVVGLLDGVARVINCYSYATITGGTTVAGIVGYNNQVSTMSNIKTIVMNCMFYGEITGGNPKYPVYGGNLIDNAGTDAINNYNYFRSDAEFDDAYTDIKNYNRSWPAEEKYLTRFEYYRSILNSNRHLCTFWITNKQGSEQTAADTALVAKWVLDPDIAPYPILKKWGKYPSVINPIPVNILGSLNVTVEPGSHNSEAPSQTITLPITDMDEDNHDFGYYKVQLPYYNELFGNPNSNDHATRYGNNYTDMAVTGWDIVDVTGGTPISDKAGVDEDGVPYDHTFTAHWESGYNFADRYCTDKDKFSVSGRVFAQGGYYYVPEGVTAITIRAHWGTAVYVRNKDNSIDRINTTEDTEKNGKSVSFAPAGTLPPTFQGQTVFTSIQDAIKSSRFSNLGAGKTVYDQAVVLVGNIQVRNGGTLVNNSGNNARPYTLMSADFDLDNEPDFCLQLQFRDDLERPRVQPVRFDFLSVPELGLAIRPDSKAWAIGIMVPAGHFEITETACMHTTQFEYDGAVSKVESPLILNGGHFEQIVVRYGSTGKSNGNADRTSYIIMGGRFWMKRFTPGNHANTGNNAKVRHCAVNVIGGEFPEFYLSGIYRALSDTYVDNPHCYINGGKFGMIAGAGMEQIKGDITFKIDHAIIDEFYGGGINASLPVLGKIDVTIDNSRVGKYCGGPKVGILGTTSAYQTVTTHATGTTFGEYYGGGNGGTSYYREQKQDGDASFPTQSASGWGNYGYSGFNPLNTVSGVGQTRDNSATNKGYHGEYEFEVFNNSNGTTDNCVVRAYYLWVQFGTTGTGTVTNYLKDCTVNGDFYGGGNLGNVYGDVNSTLTGTTHVSGSAFAAGFSAAIPTFRIHDKENATTNNFPGRDFTGVITDHTLDYKKDASGNEIYYTWSNTPKPGTTGDNRWRQATYLGEDGKWYCWTWVPLEDLGNVSGNASITIEGNCDIDVNVFGGGNESAVEGNTKVTLKDNAKVAGSVYGGGNEGLVGGSTDVNVE